MKRSFINFIVDFSSFVILVFLASTGIIIKYVLPPGTGGRGREVTGGRGREAVKDLWSMARHEWGNIHFYLAIGFLVLMVLHIILHWNWIKNYVKSLFGFGRQRHTEVIQ